MAIPSPTLATPTVDYIPAGKRRYVFVPTIAIPATPTSAEISAGTDYTNSITGASGWNLSAASVDNATYGQTYNSTVPGVLSSDACSWTLKASSTSTDARTLLTINTNGFVCIFSEGIVSSGKMDVWPVRVSSTNVDQVARDALATITVDFAIPGQPIQFVAIPSS